MKKTAVLVTVLICLLSVSPVYANWMNNWKINGIQLSRFKNIQTKEVFELGAGVLASFAVHWAGHVIFLETHNKDWYQDGFSEICTSPLTDSEGQWFGRSGMVAQLIVGTGLKFTKYNDSFFATGYHIGTFVEIAAYPFIHNDDGDLHLIDKFGGNWELEYGVYTLWSGLLLATD